MDEFLGSLTVHVDESVSDLQGMLKRNKRLESQFKYIKDAANQALFSRPSNAIKKRPKKTPRSPANNGQAHEESSEMAVFVPASQYPLPMSPPVFKHKRPGVIPKQLLGYTRHPASADNTKPVPPDEIPPLLPTLDIESIKS